MNAKRVEYPAKLVGYRIDAVHDRIVLFADVPVLFADAELERRLVSYRALEEAGGGDPQERKWGRWWSYHHGP